MSGKYFPSAHEVNKKAEKCIRKLADEGDHSSLRFRWRDFMCGRRRRPAILCFVMNILDIGPKIGIKEYRTENERRVGCNIQVYL